VEGGEGVVGVNSSSQEGGQLAVELGKGGEEREV